MFSDPFESGRFQSEFSFSQRGLDDWSPRDIEQWLHRDGNIVGQDAAVRAAALIVYNHYEGRPSVSLFAGPTGSGKTEIWRALRREYSGQNIVIQDASTLSAEGWRGGNKISTIFRAIRPDRREKAILVLDECDKLLEPMYGAGGTNYSDLLQNQLLRLCDHDTLFFGSEEGRDGFTVDCTGVSVVLLGAFDRLLTQKSRARGAMGFERAIGRQTGQPVQLTQEDLMDYGMRAELAGRIDRIVCMQPLSVKELVQIGRNEIARLEQVMHREIRVDLSALIMLSRMAVGKGLGARWLKSRLGQMLDDLLYDDPDADCYEITYEPPDADARRQAMGRD